MTFAPSDRESIQTTIASIPHFIDKKRWADLRNLYAETVQTDYTSLFGGEVQEQPGDALIEAWRKLLTPIVTQHLLGPITVELAPATATARCHVRGYHYAKGTAGGDEDGRRALRVRPRSGGLGMENPGDDARAPLPERQRPAPRACRREVTSAAQPATAHHPGE
jgi:hypothetical protein